jgi:3-oxoacyl-(acyl-carrier-protein) synthase
MLPDESLGVTRKESRFMGHSSRLALAAARQALADAGIDDPTPLAVVVGSGVGDTPTQAEIHARVAETGNVRRVLPTAVPRLMGSTVSANLSNVLRTRGPSCTVTAACAGGAWNLVLAATLVRDGLAPAALAGGVEVRDVPFHLGFDSMRAYCADDDGTDDDASRPYAADRAGFIFGEGAGIVVLERRRDAERRGAPILAVLRGWGMSSDGEGEMVQPSRDGAARAMRSALAFSGVAAQEVGYVNTHGTSTPAGDVEEVRALEAVFGGGIPYSSTKGYTGHTISAAGAIEAVLTAVMLRDQTAFAARLSRPLDPALAGHPPLLQHAALHEPFAVSNSFGFGGTNACLVLERA